MNLLKKAVLVPTMATMLFTVKTPLNAYEKEYNDMGGNITTSFDNLNSNESIQNETIRFDLKSNNESGWQYNGETWRYYKNGIYMVSEWLEENGKRFYFNSDGSMVSSTILNLDSQAYAFKENGELIVEQGWYELKLQTLESYVWIYVLSNGSLKTGWLEDGEKKYYFDNYDGTMYSDMCAVIDGKGYIFNSLGQITNKEGWYYFSTTSSWTYITSSGFAQEGWLQKQGKWYYFNDLGYMVASETHEIDGTIYIFDVNGSLVEERGWYSIKNSFGDTEWLYLNSGGNVHTGWLKYLNDWYYFDEYQGFMATGMLKDKDQFYYLEENGRLTTRIGWQKVSVEDEFYWQYLHPGGQIHKGWLQLNGNWYYFGSFLLTNSSMGALYVHGMFQEYRELIDSEVYYFDSDGKMSNTGWEETGQDDWIYAKESGALQTTWMKEGNDWYHFSRMGVMSSDGLTFVFDEPRGEEYYIFDKNGRMLRDTWFYDAKPFRIPFWVYANTNGQPKTGWFEENGQLYYFSEGKNTDRLRGEMLVNCVEIIDSIEYTFDNNSVATRNL